MSDKIMLKWHRQTDMLDELDIGEAVPWALEVRGYRLWVNAFGWSAMTAERPRKDVAEGYANNTYEGRVKAEKWLEQQTIVQFGPLIEEEVSCDNL